MTDGQGRNITYMRISITDRCNLRCRYCMAEDMALAEHDEILRYEEILRICSAAVSLGIRNFRVTGGEPSVRRNYLEFLEQLKALRGVQSVSVSTNGVLLAPHISTLAAMGIDSINISLDTRDRALYQQLTGKDVLADVLRSVRTAAKAGLRVKVNCVPMAGVNEHELVSLASLAEEMPVDVRFIELMPTGVSRIFSPVLNQEVQSLLRDAYPDLHPVSEQRGWGPARYFSAARLRGRIGFINTLSGHICADCNRVRLTSEGFLKPCLYHETGVSLRELIRAGADDGKLSEVMRKTIYGKPDRHHFGECAAGGVYAMSRIGG